MLYEATFVLVMDDPDEKGKAASAGTTDVTESFVDRERGFAEFGLHPAAAQSPLFPPVFERSATAKDIPRSNTFSMS